MAHPLTRTAPISSLMLLPGAYRWSELVDRPEIKPDFIARAAQSGVDAAIFNNHAKPAWQLLQDIAARLIKLPHGQEQQVTVNHLYGWVSGTEAAVQLEKLLLEGAAPPTSATVRVRENKKTMWFMSHLFFVAFPPQLLGDAGPLFWATARATCTSASPLAEHAYCRA